MNITCRVFRLIIERADASGAIGGRTSSCFMQMRPFFCTGRYVTSKPCCCRMRHESSTHLCSVCVVITWFFLPGNQKGLHEPRRATHQHVPPPPQRSNGPSGCMD
jgi:hypothetical protein